MSTYRPPVSTRQPNDLISSFMIRNAQIDVEMQSNDPPVGPPIDLPINPPIKDPRDGRTESEHWSEDPHFIADYLAHNTSKAAAVFRRYDRLVIYRLLLLNRELNGLEKEHDEYVAEKVEKAVDPETAEQAATEQAAAEQAAAEPVTAEPVTAEPVTAEPVTAEPVTAEQLEDTDFNDRIDIAVKNYCRELRNVRMNGAVH